MNEDWCRIPVTERDRRQFGEPVRSVDGIATRAIGRPSLLFDSGSLKRRFNRLNADIDLFLRQLAE
jgi:hypothetical protein